LPEGLESVEEEANVLLEPDHTLSRKSSLKTNRTCNSFSGPSCTRFSLNQNIVNSLRLGI